MMRAKFQVQGVEKHGEPATSETVRMSPVSKYPYGEEGASEDNTYARYTPNGSLSLTINNPNLLGKFSVGQKFYADFTEAPE